MRRAALLLGMLLASCRPPAGEADNEAAPAQANEARSAIPANRENMVREVDTASFRKALNETENDGLDHLTPGQRRAYLKGMEDCHAGRYDPDPWPEAYRIGCAAAQEDEHVRR
jgi:hypothetical protein